MLNLCPANRLRTVSRHKGLTPWQPQTKGRRCNIYKIGKDKLAGVLKEAAELIADLEAETDRPKTPTRKKLEEIIQGFEGNVTVKINFWD